MGLARFEEMATPQPVPGYGLRTSRPGDEAAWLAVLSTVADWEWNNDRAKLDRMIEGERAHLPPRAFGSRRRTMFLLPLPVGFVIRMKASWAGSLRIQSIKATAWRCRFVVRCCNFFISRAIAMLTSRPKIFAQRQFGCI